MFTLIILLLAVSQNHGDSRAHKSTGSLDELGVCHCSVVLPDSTFPPDHLEKLEISNLNLSLTVQEQITKVISMERLVNLTKHVEEMEKGGQSDSEVDFELLKMEIREMEALTLPLKSSMNETNVLVETLYQEIHNIYTMVNHMEVYDKKNVRVIRREINAMKKRLEDWEKNPIKPMSDLPLPPTSNGTCHHGPIVSISKPYVVQLNYQGINFISGGWGKDSIAGADDNGHWVSPLYTDGRMMYYLRLYNSYNDLQLQNYKLDRGIPVGNYGQGGGMIMYNNLMYYNCYNTGNLCKYNPQLNRVELSVDLPNATSNNRFTYSSSVYQDIDMAADEEGLWVIYSTETNAGNIVLSRIDPISLVVQQTWNTSLYKPAATNAFMMCGVLYVTRAINIKTEEIFYMYDTKTGKEGRLSVPLEKPKEKVQSLSYNPNDQKLYMYNDGFLVNYGVIFKPQGDKSQI